MVIDNVDNLRDGKNEGTEKNKVAIKKREVPFTYILDINIRTLSLTVVIKQVVRIH